MTHIATKISTQIVDNYVNNPVDNPKDNSVNNPILAKNSTKKHQNFVENSALAEQWIAWCIQQYAIECSAKIYEILQQIFVEMSLGNSTILLNNQQIQLVKQLNQAYYHVQQRDDIAHILHAPRPFIFDGHALSLYRYWLWEYEFAEKIIAMSQPVQQTKDWAVDVQYLTSQLAVSDDYQRQAVEKAITQNLTLITGGPGTGKTFTLAQIIALLFAINPKLRIAMSAPTGKASQRMQEALQNAIKHLPERLKNPQLEQQQTMTLHRLLGLGHQQQAKYHQHNPLPYDVVVVDEASMLDLNLARQLFNAIPAHCRLILLGDVHQLASVDVGAVLADLQSLPILKNYRQHLVHSRRFDSQSKIGQIAQFIQQRFVLSAEALQADDALQQWTKLVTPAPLNPDAIRQQQVQCAWIDEPSVQDYEILMQGFQTFTEKLMAYRQHLSSWQELSNIVYPDDKIIQELCAIFDQYRILTATQHGHFGVQMLNNFAEQWVQRALSRHTEHFKSYDWYIGKAVMMTYNDYQLGLSNGDIGLCLYRQREMFFVYFPSLNRWYPASRLPSNIQPAFALTIHKSQGSEFQHTAVILDDAAERLLSLELFYTAITRAKTELSILTTARALSLALQRKHQRVSRVQQKVQFLSGS